MSVFLGPFPVRCSTIIHYSKTTTSFTLLVSGVHILVRSPDPEAVHSGAADPLEGGHVHVLPVAHLHVGVDVEVAVGCLTLRGVDGV